MDNLTLALKLTGKEKTTEEKSESLNPSTASIVYMVAVTASSGGEVVLKDEVDESAEWEEGDFTEVDEEGDYEEYESDDDPLEDVDNAVVDMTDGDGVDIDDTGSDAIAYTVADYHEDAVAAYSEEEGDAVVDDLPDEDTGISDAIDDGDATEFPDDGMPSYEDGLPDENATIDEISDNDYTLTDDNSDDESDEIEGAEVSDGYTVAECIGSVKAGDRVSVLIQGGRVTVLGVVGSGDEEEALRRQAEETAEAANELAESASENAEEAKESAEQAESKADQAIQAADTAKKQAASAEEVAKSASDSAKKVESGLQNITDDLLTVKTDASQTLAQAIDATTEKKVEVMTASFATKGELKEQAVDLKSEIVRSAGKIQTTLEASYTRKTDLTEAKVEMQSQIAQTAEAIELTVLGITDAMANTHDETIKAQIAQAKIDLENAKASLETAKATLAEAQKNEQIAKDNAAAAQNALSDANAELSSARSDLAKAQSYYNDLVRLGASTKEIEAAANDVAEAESAVARATTKVNQAVADANAASVAVTNAANAVITAEADVESAQADYDLAVNGLHTYNMTAIQQTADAINLKASKKDLEGYVTTTQFQVTADGFTTEINTAKSSAAAAQTAASNAQSTADTASTNATSALNRSIQYGTCATAAATAAKVVVQANFALYTGATVYVKFTYANTVANPTLNVNSTGAKAIRAYGAALTATSIYNWTAGSIVTFVYDGTYWNISDSAGLAKANDASKTATNFLSYDSTNGLIIGNKSSGSWSGSRAQITSSAFNILGSNGTVLASYQANQIDLGVNGEGTVINLCGGVGSIKTTKTANEWRRLVIDAQDGISQFASGAIFLDTEVGDPTGDYSHNYITLTSREVWNSNQMNTYVRIMSEHSGAGGDDGYEELIFLPQMVRLSTVTSGKSADILLTVSETESTCRIAANSTWISGNVTTYENVRLGTNNRALIATNNNGADRRLLMLNANNNCVINYDGFSNDEGNANIYGSQVNLYIPYGTGNVGVALEKPASSSDLAGYFRPSRTALVSLGTSSLKWYRLIQSHASVDTSDEREKENIVPLGGSSVATYSVRGGDASIDVHSELFDRLIPVRYNFIEEDARICYGLIAQQVVSVMEELGIDENELDLVHHDSWIDEETGEEKDSYGIAYTNLIALLIHEVQKLKQQIS